MSHLVYITLFGEMDGVTLSRLDCRWALNDYIDLSHLVHVVLIPKTHTNLPGLRISEDWPFYYVILNSWTHARLPYISSKLHEIWNLVS